MNKDKRNDLKILGLALCATSPILPNKWKTPIVNAVLLPAHAQASFCMEGGDIVGNWAFYFDDGTHPTVVSLSSDGSGRSVDSPGSNYSGGLKWEVNSEEIVIYSVDDAGSDSGQIKYKAIITQPCETMSGQVESLTADYIGTFNAEHCPDDDCNFVI